MIAMEQWKCKAMKVMKHLKMNYILAMNNPYTVDIQLNKLTKSNKCIRLVVKHAWHVLLSVVTRIHWLRL